MTTPYSDRVDALVRKFVADWRALDDVPAHDCPGTAGGHEIGCAALKPAPAHVVNATGYVPHCSCTPCLAAMARECGLGACGPREVEFAALRKVAEAARAYVAVASTCTAEAHYYNPECEPAETALRAALEALPKETT